MRICHVTAAITALIVVCVSCAAQSGPGQKNADPLLQRYQSMGSLDAAGCEALVGDSFNDLEEKEEALEDSLRPTNPPQVRCCAAFLIGKYRFASFWAIQDLSDAITLHYPTFDIKEPLHYGEPPWGPYPAISAMMKIGLPCVPKMLDNLARSDESQVRNDSLAVIRYVEPSADAAKAALRDALRAEKDPTRAARLKAALAAF